MADEETKNLGLGVIFQAILGDFSQQLDAVKTKLKEMASEMEAMSKKGSESARNIAKAQEKVTEAAKKTTEAAKTASKEAISSTDGLSSSTAKATTIAKAHGKSVAEVTEDLGMLGKATVSQIHASEMSAPVYDMLARKMKTARTESDGYKKALADMALDSKTTVNSFKNFVGALDSNEKMLLQSEKAFGAVRSQLGTNALPRDLKNWINEVDRGKFAQATLNGELYKTGGIVLDGKTKFASLQRSLASLKKEFGESAWTATEMGTRFGSYVKTISAARTELSNYTKDQIPFNKYLVEANNIIRTTTADMNQLGMSGEKWAKGVDSSTVATSFMRNELINANGTILQMGKTFLQTNQEVTRIGNNFKDKLGPNTFNNITSQLGSGIKSLNAYKEALETASSRSVNARSGVDLLNKAHAELNKVVGLSATAHAHLAKAVDSGGLSLRSAVTAAKVLTTSTTQLESQNIRLTSRYSELINSMTPFGEKARGIVASMKPGNDAMNVANDSLKRLNTAFITSEKGIKVFNDAVKNLGTLTPQSTSYINDLQNRINAGNLTHADAAKQIARHGKELQNLRVEAQKVTGFWSNLTGKLIGGGAAAAGASDYLSRLGQAVGSLAAWIPAALIIGGLTQVVMGAIGAVKEFDQSLKSLQAISQGTDAEIELLGKEMIKVSNSTKYSLTEIGKGAIYIAQAGFTAGESLQVIRAAALGAQGTLEPLTVAADLLTTVIRAFKLDAEGASGIMDMLAMAANKSKTNLEGMKTVFNYLGPTAKAAGLSLSETLGALMLLSNVGMRMSTVGTSLRQVVIALENPNARLQKALIAHGMSVSDLSLKNLGLIKVSENLGKVIGGSLTNAVQFFNVRAGNAALVLSTMPTYLKALINYSLQYGAAVAMAGKQTEGLDMSLHILLNRFQNLFVTISEGKITGLLKGIIDGLIYLMKVLSDFAKSWEGSFVGSFLVFGAILLGSVKVIGWVVAGLGSLSTAVYATSGAVASLSAILNAIGLTALLNPITAIIVALVALSAGVYTFARSQQLSNAELQQNAILYTENAAAAKKLSETLSDLKKQQDEGKIVTDNYLAVLKQIRDKFPELTVDMVRTNNDLDKQSKLLAKNAEVWEKRADKMIDISTSKIASDIREVDAALNQQHKIIMNNESMWTRWGKGLLSVFTIVANSALVLLKNSTAIEAVTRAWQNFKAALHFTREESNLSVVQDLAGLSEKNRNNLEQAAQQISMVKKELREPLFIKFEAQGLQPLLRELVRLRDLEKEAMEAGTYTEGAKVAIRQSEEIAAMKVANANRTALAINDYEETVLENRLKKGLIEEQSYYNEKENLVKRRFSLEADLIESTWKVQDEKHQRTIQDAVKEEVKSKAIIARKLDEMKKEEALVTLGYKKKEALDNLSTSQVLSNIKDMEDALATSTAIQSIIRKKFYDKEAFSIKERETANEWAFSNNLRGEKEYVAESLGLIEKRRIDSHKELEDEKNDYKSTYDENIELYKENSAKLAELHRDWTVKKQSIKAASDKVDQDAEEASNQIKLNYEARALQIRLSKIDEFYAIKEILRNADFDKESFNITERETMNSWLYDQDWITAREYYDRKRKIIDDDWLLTKSNLEEEFTAFKESQEKKRNEAGVTSEFARKIDAETEAAHLTLLANMDKSDRDHLSKLRDVAREMKTDWEILYEEGIVKVVGESLRRIIASYEKYGSRLNDLTKDIASGMADNFNTFYTDAFNGQLKTASDYFISFLNSLKASMVKFLADQTTLAFLNIIGKGLGNALGATYSSAPVKQQYSAPVVLHQGGIVGQDTLPTRKVPSWVYNNAPRFHLGSDEVPAILQAGETVIPRGASKLGSLEIKVINESNQEMGVTKTKAQQIDAQRTLVTLWMDAANRNVGGLRSYLGG